MIKFVLLISLLYAWSIDFGQAEVVQPPALGITAPYGVGGEDARREWFSHMQKKNREWRLYNSMNGEKGALDNDEKKIGGAGLRGQAAGNRKQFNSIKHKLPGNRLAFNSGLKPGFHNSGRRGNNRPNRFGPPNWNGPSVVGSVQPGDNRRPGRRPGRPDKRPRGDRDCKQGEECKLNLIFKLKGVSDEAQLKTKTEEAINQLLGESATLNSFDLTKKGKPGSEFARFIFEIVLTKNDADEPAKELKMKIGEALKDNVFVGEIEVYERGSSRPPKDANPASDGNEDEPSNEAGAGPSDDEGPPPPSDGESPSDAEGSGNMSDPSDTN